jgi:hypothetical protein
MKCLVAKGYLGVAQEADIRMTFPKLQKSRYFYQTLLLPIVLKTTFLYIMRYMSNNNIFNIQPVCLDQQSLPYGRLWGSRSTMIMVMLSPPIPCDARGSALTISSSISSPISRGCLLLMRSRTYLTHSSLVRQSQIPSHPNTMNSSPALKVALCSQAIASSVLRLIQKTTDCGNSHHIISGSAVIICSAGGIPGTCLYFKSPIDLDRFKLPFTRPN